MNTKEIAQFRHSVGALVDLSRRPTRIDPRYDGKNGYEKKLRKATQELRHYQTMLYADDRYSLLVIFQAMDAAGKDGAIKHVMEGVNPQGTQVFSFKAPSKEELDHDFLWRAAQRLPERGRIGIFNRSYYEEVLVVRVHPAILAGQPLPDEIRESPGIWQQRYRSINDFESHLVRNGTRVVKFFLHLSKEEQRVRFLERIDDPEKQWKFSEADVKERGHWDRYQEVYGEMIGATSTAEAPWWVIPADNKKTARLLISSVLIRELAALPLRFPAGSETSERLAALRAQLEAEENRPGR